MSTPGSFRKLPPGPGLLPLASEGRSCGHLHRPATFSLAAEHLLNSFPHFLWSQRHHHLSYRRALLRTNKRKRCLQLSEEHTPGLSCRSYAQANAAPQGAGCAFYGLQFLRLRMGPRACSTWAGMSLHPIHCQLPEGGGWHVCFIHYWIHCT